MAAFNLRPARAGGWILLRASVTRGGQAVLRRVITWPALAILLSTASQFGCREAYAQYGPVVGDGYAFSTVDLQTTDFTTNNGSFDLNYIPSDPFNSSIYVSTGSAGYSFFADRNFSVSSDGTMFSADYGYDGSITLSFYGTGGSIAVQPSWIDDGDEVYFEGFFGPASNPPHGSVPEPSSLLTLALGVGGLLLARHVGRGKWRLRAAH